MKTAICFYSGHHGNTKKVVEKIASVHNDVKLIDISEQSEAKLSDFDRIGIASGIYYLDFSKQLYSFIENNLPEHKSVFLIYTAGMGKSERFEKRIKLILNEKHSNIIGTFGCSGFDTFGPLRFIGGVKKGHPDEKELSDALSFYEGLK